MLMEDIQIEVYRSTLKIPAIFLVPATCALTIYAVLYLFLNSNLLIEQVQVQANEVLPGQFSLGKIISDSSLTTFQIHDAKIRSSTGEPIIDSGSVEFSYNPLLLLGRRFQISYVNITDARVHIGLENRVNLLRALGLYKEEKKEKKASRFKLDIGINNIAITDSYFSYSMEHLSFKVPHANIIGANLSIKNGALSVHVPEIKIDTIPFHFEHELFHLNEKWGDWEPTAEEVHLEHWRWEGDGFTTEKLSFLLDGTQLSASGLMDFPNNVPDDRSVVYQGKARLSGPYWSRATQYFVKDFVHVDAEYIDLEVIGNLEKVDLLSTYKLTQLDAYGLQFFDVEGSFDLDNQYISMGSTKGRVSGGGTMDVGSAFYDMYTGVFGATLSLNEVDPYTAIQAFGFEYPYLEGKASGAFEMIGQVPYEDNVDDSLPLLAGFSDAAHPLISVELLSEATFERASKEILPGQKFKIKKGTKIWSQIDRVGVPKAHITSELGQYKFQDFVLHYDNYEIERTLTNRKMRATIESREFGKLVSFYGGKGFDGALKLNIDAIGRLNFPDANISLDINEPLLSMGGVDWKGESIRFSGSLAEGRLSISELNLVGASGGGDIRGYIDILKNPLGHLDEKGLMTKDFLYPSQNKANLNVNIAALNLADFARSSMLNVEMNPSGLMDIEGNIKGSLQRPEGQLNITAKNVEVYGQKMRNLSSQLRFQKDGSYAFEKSEIDLGRAGFIEGDFSAKGNQIRYNFTGKDLELQNLDLLKKTNLSVSGGGKFRIHGKGTYDSPNPGGYLRIDNVRLLGRDLGDLALVVNTIDSTVHLAGALLPWVTIDAEVPLDNSTYYARFGIDDIDLSDALPEIRDLGIVQDSSATGIIEFFLEPDFSRYQILVNLSELKVDAFGKQFRNEGPVIAGLNEGRLLQIQRSRFGVDDRFLDIHGGVFLDQSLIDLEIQGDMELSSLNGIRLAFPAYVPEILLEAEGNAKVDLKISGPPDAIAANGMLSFGKSAFLLRGFSEPLAISGGKIRISEAKIEVDPQEMIKGRMLGGLFSVSGKVALDNMKPQNVDLKVRSQNMGYRIPEVADISFGSNLRIQISDFDRPQTWLVSGEVDILDGLYYQNFSVLQDALTNRLLGTFTQSRERYDASIFERFPEIAEIGWDVNLIARDGVKIRSEVDRLGLDIELRLGLRLRNTLLDPNLTGEINVIGGLVKFQGEAFRVRNGTLNFEGDPKNPRVELIAEADIENACRAPENPNQGQTMTLSGVADQGEQLTYHVILNVNGQLSNMNIQFESNPFADQRDILSLMLTGCTVDQLTASSAGSPTLEVALGPVLGWIEGQVQDAVKVEEFTITPSFDRLKATVGDSVTRRISWRFQLDTGLTDSAGGQLGQVVYKISDQFSALLSESTSNNARSEESNFLIEVKLKYRLLID